MELHNRLREYRLKRGLTQETLAKMVMVTRQTIIAIEKGGYTPSVKLALELAQSLEAPIDDIFWLDEKKGSQT